MTLNIPKSFLRIIKTQKKFRRLVETSLLRLARALSNLYLSKDR